MYNVSWLLVRRGIMQILRRGRIAMKIVRRRGMPRMGRWRRWRIF